MDNILIAIVFVLATAGLYVLLLAAVRRDSKERRGLENLVEHRGSPTSFAEPSISRRETLGQASRQWRRFDSYRSLERMLERAGWKLTPVEFGAIACAITIAGAFAIWLWQGDVLWGIVAAIAIAIAVPASLEIARVRRMARFESALPEALELMAASLRSGQGFQRALQVTAEDMPNPVKEEFGLAVQDIMVGHTVEEALQSVWNRVPSYEMELITTAISIQLQVGGNLSEILQKIAETLRERARIRGEISTLTAEGKLSAIFAFAIPIMLYFYLKAVNPSYMAPLTQTDIGKMMLYAAAGSECIGMAIIWKMVSMEV